jgi:hypothetical protein
MPPASQNRSRSYSYVSSDEEVEEVEKPFQYGGGLRVDGNLSYNGYSAGKRRKIDGNGFEPLGEGGGWNQL